MIALVASVWAGQLSLDLDTAELREGQSIGLTVTVADARARGVPAVPVPDGLTVDYRTQSEQTLVINFNHTSSTAYRYALTAMRAGDYTIGPIEVSTSAGLLRSQPVKLHVAPRGGDGLNDLTAEVGGDTAWVGQVVVYHMRFETDKALVNGRWSAPDGPGLTVEPSVQPVTAEYPVGDGGAIRTVSELFYPLRLGRSGDIVVPSGVFRAQFAVQGRRRRGGNSPMDSLFEDLQGMSQVASETYSAKPLTLHVRDLPGEGRPATFGGLVGHVEVTSRASSTDVSVGDTVTVEVDVTSDTPLAGFTLPPLPGTGFRVYDDQPTTEAKLVDGKIVATAKYKRAVVPETPGDLRLPAIEVTTFDPEAGRYVTSSSEPIVLRVGGTARGAEVSSFAGPARTEVGALADDILPVRTEGRVAAPWSGRWAWILLVPGLGLLVAQAAGAWRSRPRAVVERRYDFGDLPPDPEGRLAGLDRIFRERVAAKVGVTPAALRREEVASLGDEAESVFRELERLRYRGAHGTLPEDAVRRVVDGL